jgi:hypothetical protein
MRNPPPDTVLVWDPIYGARNANTERALTLDEIRAAGWVQVPEFDPTLRAPTTPSSRPTPDPQDQLAPQGKWAVFVHPPGARSDPVKK